MHAHPSIEIVEEVTADDLIVEENRVCGVYACDNATGDAQIAFRAGAVVLATGGVGRLYRYTTNPVEATGDGIAMAARAGALLADMEFVQFHPTALAIGRDPMPLVTEAVRGEGATLVNDLGERFMLALHPDAELAPRDVVARAIFEQQQRGRTVGLDARERDRREISRSLSDRLWLLHRSRYRSARAEHSGRSGRALPHGRNRR